jgi:RimJ/RimL family protein N-acetyltransferase
MDLSIRTIEKTDIENIRIWRNEQTDILRQVNFISQIEQEEYFTKIHNDNKQILFAIDDKNNFVGYCGLVNLDFIYSTAEISFVAKTNLDKLYYKNLFNFTLKYLGDYAFNTLNLNKIWTETYSFRKYHISILEDFGMVKEGILREHVYIKGKRHNSIIHSKLKKEHV